MPRQPWLTGSSAPHIQPVLAFVLMLGQACQAPELRASAPSEREQQLGATPLDWCLHTRGGSPGTRAIAIDLSAAHAASRFFGAERRYSEVDQALAAALDDNDALDPRGVASTLSRYSEALRQNVCDLIADGRPLPAARVERIGDVALIHPGTGSVSLPEGAQVAVVDLRELPWAEGLREALAAAVAPALATPVSRPTRNVREHDGMTDEVVFEVGPFVNRVRQLNQPDIEATGSKELPLVLITDGTMPPDAAELAGTLRLANRAWLWGEPVFAATAEASWQGIGEFGLAYRASDLLQNGKRWPDVIVDDGLGPILEARLQSLGGIGMPSERPVSSGLRSYVSPITPYHDRQPPTARLGDFRAALLIAHGAVRLFYPYFYVVGDNIDERLLEVLPQAEEVVGDRPAARDLLRRFGEVLRDGHNSVYAVTSVPGIFPAIIDVIGQEAVVQRSPDPAIQPGDTLVEFAGVSTAELYARELPRTSAANPDYAFIKATSAVTRMLGPTEVKLRSPDGAIRQVVAQPMTLEPYLQMRADQRRAGWLTDLGAPNLYYLNMDQYVLTDIRDFDAQVTEAQAADGLVLDMRGYPGGINHYEAVKRLINQPFTSPLFLQPRLTGPDLRSVFSILYNFTPVEPAFRGPIALLVGPSSASAAENFSTMLVDSHRVSVVGRRSAATNGNITGIELPSGFEFTYTSLDVRHADGSIFHGIGIVPDLPVELSPAALRDGIDRELQQAIQLLRGRTVRR